jgi:hypothetical protein
MYTFGPPGLALGFAATLRTETFQAKVFYREGAAIGSYQGCRGQALEDGVFSVKKSRDRCDMRNVRTRQKSRPLCNVLFHDKLGSGQHYAHEFSGRVPFDVLGRARLKISTQGN